MLGTFTPESLKKFAEANGFDTENADFSEGVFDFKICEKPNKERYGIPNSDKCKSPNKEVKNSPNPLGEIKYNPAPSVKKDKKKGGLGEYKFDPAPSTKELARAEQLARSRAAFMSPRPIIGGSNDINSSRTPVKPKNNAKRIEHTYSRKEALAEACDAGRQYRKDVDTGFMRPSQAEAEASSYAHHLASKSEGVDRYELYEKIKQGLWHDRCF